jgi:tetratricopeptide (TPR) repeat protein
MTARLVFRDSAGRELTTRDLRGFTGKVNWEVLGGEQVPAKARRLHQQAREAGGRGDYDQALALLDQAQILAPDWPYPPYDAAFTALLQGDPTRAEELYDRVDRLAPRGFFTCKTTLDMLRRERTGKLFPGFSLAYTRLEWINDPDQKKAILQGIVARYPRFPPAWKDLSTLLTDPHDRLQAITHGLASDPDPETRGLLLINQALLLRQKGDRDTAIAILGELALDPTSTLGTETLAKAALAGFL